MLCKIYIQLPENMVRAALLNIELQLYLDKKIYIIVR